MNTILEMKNISKAYPGVQALDRIDFSLKLGEVHALVGENGAGKSTLMKILAGAEPMDEGQIFVSGQPVQFSSPQDSKRHGVALIYQEFNLIPELTVADNIFLGMEPLKAGFIQHRKLIQDSEAILERIGVSIDPKLKVKNLSIVGSASFISLIDLKKSLTLPIESLFSEMGNTWQPVR